ncbi:MAG: hypothetical protein WD750_13495 [Gammaproteobacteria bacterium]
MNIKDICHGEQEKTAVSMLRNVVSFSVGITAGSFAMFWSITSAVMGFMVDLVLVIVVLVSNKSDYRPTNNV